MKANAKTAVAKGIVTSLLFAATMAAFTLLGSGCEGIDVNTGDKSTTTITDSHDTTTITTVSTNEDTGAITTNETEVAQ